ncbi:dihydrofolate reductase family protein [Thalassobacillus pellis]|uniref:dihydrofolate reductase family protein n=1 Tax=Thalassobacillus pellis TaxID=748008 RepID=UPI00195FE463|nr:dihydrofolate reductase family protein [Thalassobacillus pellis]MBM7551149.1 dihydrofolate reductase [Thalassobacillus pellis]
MGKVILFIAMSLDGYISQENEEIDWLWKEENYDYEKFYASIDTVILGRKTYDQVLERYDEFPYRMKDVYVVSNLQEGNEEYARFIQPEQIRPLVNLLKEDQDKNIWIVGGAKLIQHFIQKQLIDEFQITIQPTLLGSGIPLFPPGGIEQQLELYEVKPHPTGMLMLTYHKK